MKTQLSTLENVDIRSIWENETNEFTPWLANSDNIDHIGEAIGIDLTVEEKRNLWDHIELIYSAKMREIILY